MTYSIRLFSTLAFLSAWIWTSNAHAFASLVEVLQPEAKLAGFLPAYDMRAALQDGSLLGTGSERLQHTADGNLRIERTRHYTHVRNLETGLTVPLPEPWKVVAVLIVTPSLRLVSCDTRFHFKRAADAVLGEDYKLSARHPWLFEKDRSLLRATKDGAGLLRQDYLGSKLIKTERCDYPPEALPVELLGLFMGIAVQRGLDKFDFELIAPGGDSHCVLAEVQRTRDVRRFAAGYRVPAQRLHAKDTLAVVDIRLSSALKSLFFPHHFYLAYSAAEPWKLMMVWGGDPDETIQAFRMD